MTKRIVHAIAFKLQCRDASIPEVMHVAKFTLTENLNLAKQMAVCRSYEKAIGSKSKAPPPNLIEALVPCTFWKIAG